MSRRDIQSLLSNETFTEGVSPLCQYTEPVPCTAIRVNGENEEPVVRPVATLNYNNVVLEDMPDNYYLPAIVQEDVMYVDNDPMLSKWFVTITLDCDSVCAPCA